MAENVTGLTSTPFTISKASDGVTYLTANLATSANPQTVLTYAVPLGQAIRIEPYNYIFGNLFDTGGTRITAGSSVLLKANSNLAGVRELWRGPNAIFKDIGDEFQRPKLRAPVTLNASQRLVYQVINLGTTLASATSDFFVECTQFFEDV